MKLTAKLYLYVPYRPEPQARPRANWEKRVVYSKHPDFYHSVVYHASQKRPLAPFNSAVRLCLRFVYKKPAVRRFEIYKTTKPDLDNLEKTVMDALTTAKWWTDDSIVVDKRSVKVWGDADYCEILAEQITNLGRFGD